MVGIPRITYALQQAEGGLEQVIEALRGYDEEDAIAFIKKYDSIPVSDRRKFGLEEIAVAAGIPTINLLGTATKALFHQSQTVAAIISSTAHPEVVKKTIQMALQDRGLRDREMVHQAQGYLPTPKGTVILNQRTQVANFNEAPKPTRSSDGDETPNNPPPVDDLPTMDDDVRGFQLDTRKLLAEPVVIEGE